MKSLKSAFDRGGRVRAVKMTVVLITLLATVAAAQRRNLQQSLEERFQKQWGFTVSYPATYRIATTPCELAQWAAGHGLQTLFYVSSSAGESNIYVALDRKRFNLENLKWYAHTGEIAPQPIEIGKYTFYYYGPGGGGVTYPDLYLYNLHGRILLIQFDGPYPPNSKTPSDRTKRVEKQVLQSFRLTPPRGSKLN